MIRELVAMFAGESDQARLRLEIARLKRIIERQQIKIAQLSRENRYLRRRLQDTEMRLLRQAETDAVLIGTLHFAGLSTSRRACAACGVSERHWRRAMALLQVGRAHDGRRIGVETPEDFERALRVAGERIGRDGFEILRHRMPLSRR